jgi:hypothetical protein
VVGDTTIQYFVIHVRYKLTVLVSFDESIFASGGCVRWSEDKGVFFSWKQRAFSSGVKAVEVQQRVVGGLNGAEVLWKVWGGQWKVY